MAGSGAASATDGSLQRPLSRVPGPWVCRKEANAPITLRQPSCAPHPPYLSPLCLKSGSRSKRLSSSLFITLIHSLTTSINTLSDLCRHTHTHSDSAVLSPSHAVQTNQQLEPEACYPSGQPFPAWSQRAPKKSERE